MKATKWIGSWQKKGTVFSDAELTAYVQDVAERMLGGTTAPENIAYRVRVLRILW